MGQIRVDWNMKDLMPKSDLLGGSISIIMRIGGEKYEAMYRHYANTITRMGRIYVENGVKAGDSIELSFVKPREYSVRFIR
jgi:hypothetical protein